MNQGIYAITNIKSNKTYIGSTINFKRRWRNHKTRLQRDAHNNPHLQYSWDKYGETAFEFGILEYLDNPEELRLAEQFWINIYRLEGKNLYNIALTTDCPMRGRKHSEETCQKMSKAKLGHSVSKETSHKISVGSKGKHVSLETRDKMSAAKAKNYPAFRNEHTNEIIPAGINLNALCREQSLNLGHMHGVITGRRHHHKGWKLL